MTADCYPYSAIHGLSRLYLDFCSGNVSVESFYASQPPDTGWQKVAAPTAHRKQLVKLLREQNPAAAAEYSLHALEQGAGVVVTGQQVGIFGGPLYTPLKAATALARAREATTAGHPHVGIFWLASEDHDFDEIRRVVFPGTKASRTLRYAATPTAACPVGGVYLGAEITQLVEEAGEALGYSDAFEALAAAWKPGNTFAKAFASFYSKVFAKQGLLVMDAAGREFHRLGASVLAAGIERADELHVALEERNRALVAAGYHAQVAVMPQASLLFLIDANTGVRQALKRTVPSAEEPRGLWHAGRQKYSTEDLLGILAVEPERISPSALLRPVFQDSLLNTSLTIGGPAEIAYFAQSAVLFEKILGKKTPAQPRWSATLIEPAVGELLRRHGLTLERIFAETPDSLAQLLAARAMPIEGKQKLAAAGNALDTELKAAQEWMQALDPGLGRSSGIAASKMRYQMNRLRRLAANFQLEKEVSLSRHALTITQALYPSGALQERIYGAAYYFARYGLGLAEEMVVQAGKASGGHTALWL